MENISGLLANVVIVIVAAFATSTLTFWGYWRQAKAELEQEYLSRFNAKKWEVYTEFTKLLQKFLVDTPANLSDLEQSIAVDVLASQIVLIGSDEVVRAFRDWRQTGMIHGKSQQVTREKLFTLVAKMRNDLGIKYSRLEVNDLLGALNPELVNS